MRHYVELAVVVVVVAILGWLHHQRLDHQAVLYRPDRGLLAFNGARPGETLQAVEARMGRPDFRNPHASFQQWEHPLTQVHYDAQGVMTSVAGSGTGVLTQDGQVLLRCGDEEERIVAVLGPPLSHQDNFYRYQVGGQGLQIHCGSSSGTKRWVSHIEITSSPHSFTSGPK